MKRRLSFSSKIMAFSFVVLCFAACTKNNSTTCAEQNALTQNADLSAALLKSTGFSAFVAATNNIVNAVDFSAINQKDAKAAISFTASKQQLTKQEFTQVLLLDHINPAIYFANSSIQQKAVKDFQAKYKLTNEQNAALWQSVILQNKNLFTVNAKFQLPDINGLITCLTGTATTFAATTAICLALREIPLIGEELYQACETEAVNTLIDNLMGCFGL